MPRGKMNEAIYLANIRNSEEVTIFRRIISDVMVKVG
jgi:hypothetical protein